VKNSEKEFLNLIQSSSTLTNILERSEQLKIPNWYFGAGCLAQTIWNLKSGWNENEFINDVDWVYFDISDLSKEAEARTESLVREHFKDIPLKFDVKNQARVHTWYEERFGYKITPYNSIHAAIETWPTTATAVAITNVKGTAKVFAPYGLEDLLTLTVRPNKKQITEAIYLSKVDRWKKCWPALRILGWNEG
jgi:hypothetical protein